MTRAKSRTIESIPEILDAFENWTQQPLGGSYLNNKPVMIKEDALKEIETMILESVDDTELKDVYSKADTTEQALPQLKVNYKSQIRANLLKILGGE